MKKFAAFLVSLAVISMIFSGCVGSEKPLSEAIADESYNQLQTITVFGENAPVGSDIPPLEPLDGTSLMPSVVVKSSMMSVLLRDWAITDLSLYAPNGYIQLEVKGEQGGESFEIGFDELKGGNVITSKINTDGIVSVTAEWTTVRIPISYIAKSTGTDLTCARQFLIGNASAPIHVRNITINSDDKERTFPEFKVNQVGYSRNRRSAHL